MTAHQEELAKEIDEQYLFAKRYLDPVHTRMNLQEELYRTYIDPTNYPHNARVFDPRIFRVIETITPRMVSNEPTGSFYPVEQGDELTTNILNILIKYDWRRADMFPKLVNFVKSMLIFGTCFARTYWDFREADRTQMEATTVNGKTMWTPKSTKKIKVTQYDGPNFEVLNMYDCFPDPNSTGLENMRWFIYRTFKTLDELKKQNEAKGGEYFTNLDELERLSSDEDKKGDTITPQDLQYREHRRTMLSTEELLGQDKSNPDIVVLRRFTTDRWVDYVPEYNLIIRDVENPYFHGELPIIHGVDYPYPGELYGMGEIEPVDRIQRAINAVLNQRLDNVQLTLRTMWKVKKQSGVDMHTLVSAPGNIVTTNDMDAVEPIQVPDVTGPTFVQTMNYLTSAMQNGTGVTDYTTGIDNTGGVANKTATGTRLIQQEANAQFKLKIQLFTHMVIQRIANQWKDLRLQYTTEEQKIRIVGKTEVANIVDTTNLGRLDNTGQEIAPGDLETQAKMNVSKNGDFAFINISPEDMQPSIVGDYDYIASVSSESLTDQVVLQENFFAALDRITNPVWIKGMELQGKMPDFEKLTGKVFEKLNIGMEAKDVVKDLPKAPAMGPNGLPGPQPGQPIPPEGMNPLMGAVRQQVQDNNPLTQNIKEMMGGQQGGPEPTAPAGA